MSCPCEAVPIARHAAPMVDHAALLRLARARAAAAGSMGDSIGGQCDAWYLRIGALLTGGACRDLEGLQALDRAADDLVAEANRIAQRPDGATLFPDVRRLAFNVDLTEYHQFSAALHGSGYDYWTADSGTILWPARTGDINAITAFDGWQTKLQAWRDEFRRMTGEEPIGPPLPEPEANKGEGTDIFGKATNLILVAGAVFVVVALVRR